MVAEKSTGKTPAPLKVRPKLELLFAKHDAAHCLAPGLFRSLAPGEREREKLKVRYAFNADTHIEFGCEEPLGVDDLRVLQGLMALASAESDLRTMLPPSPQTAEDKSLRRQMDLKDHATDEDGLKVRSSYHRLANEIGYASPNGGSTYNLLRLSIERLWKVSIIVEHLGKRYGFRLLSHYESDAKEKSLCIALNPRLTMAILSQDGEQFFHLNMNEVRGLHSDPARLIHQRLHWLNQGTSRVLKIDTLCEYVWPTPCTPNSMKYRRKQVRKALEEFPQIGWAVLYEGVSLVRIRRPKEEAIAPRHKSSGVVETAVDKVAAGLFSD